MWKDSKKVVTTALQMVELKAKMLEQKLVVMKGQLSVERLEYMMVDQMGDALEL